MKKREVKYHLKKKRQRTLVKELANNVSEFIDNEIIRVLKEIGSGQTNNQSDLIPFNNKI